MDERQRILDAMDGIAMVLDEDLHIEAIGRPNWDDFLDENSSSDEDRLRSSVENVIGHPVTAFMMGETVRFEFKRLFCSVLEKRVPFVNIDYRCDSPRMRRDMRLAVRSIASESGVSSLLYQSVTITEQARPALPMFGARLADKGGQDILSLCSICARVAWPIGAPHQEREWIEPAEYYSRGGQEVILVSHGFCDNCFAQLADQY